MSTPYWTTVVFHLPGGKTNPSTVSYDEYQKIVNEVGIEGTMIKGKRHFYIKDPNDKSVKRAMSIASTAEVDFILAQIL